MLVVDPDRADDVEAGALRGEPGEGPDGPVEALVGLDEADAEEHVLVAAGGRGWPGRVARSAVVRGDEVGAVVDEHDPRGRQAEPLEQLVALLGRVDRAPGRRPRSIEPGGATDDGSRRVAPAVVDLVDAELDLAAPPERGAEREASVPMRGPGSAAPVEDVGVELDDRPGRSPRISRAERRRRRPGP